MNRITELRKEKNMSQISLALKLNVSQKTISSYENHKNEPGIDLLCKMADMFHVSVDYLIGRTDIRDYASVSDLTWRSDEDINSLYDQLNVENRLIAKGMILGLLISQNSNHFSKTPQNQEKQQ